MSNEIFTHKFFGWLEAEARRHINPDGSEGAIVAVTARIAEGLTLSASIEIGPDAYISPRAKIGSDAKVGPRANIGSEAKIGPGAKIGPRANIGPGAKIGSDADIGPYAYIGEDAKIGPGAYIGENANIGPGAYIGLGADIGPGAHIGPRANIEKGDWFMSIGPIGSEGRHTTIVHKCGVGLRFWTGCFQDKTVAEFRAAIEETHGDNDHAAAYLWMLDSVDSHPEVLKREAVTGTGADLLQAQL
jgi:UDP-3-O-[3-hydroxymyristoyl] glucosamine N-acyltransferase